MDFYNMFKGFFGIPNSVPPPDFYKYKDYEEHNPTIILKEPNNNQDSNDMNLESFLTNHDDIMMEFFNQANQLFKSIDLFAGGFTHSHTFEDSESADKDIEALIEQFQIPSAVPNKQHENPNLREQFLKPGFDRATSNKADIDLDADGKVDINEIDSLMKQPEENSYGNQPKRHFFGRNIMKRTTVQSDGTIETITTIQDNEGNQQKIVSQKNKDGEYVITTKIGSDGNEERVEQFFDSSGKQMENWPQIGRRLEESPVDANQGQLSSVLRNWFDFFKK